MQFKLTLKFIFTFLILTCLNFSSLLANANKILLYSDSESFNKEKEVDLVLFAQGLGLGSVFLFSPYETGGLEISPFGKNKYREDIVFFAIDTVPTEHFASPKVVKNILQDIKKIQEIYKVKNIFLIGGSVGSSLVLNLASSAEKEIKEKIKGILVYLPITDYKYTMENTKYEGLKKLLVNHFSSVNIYRGGNSVEQSSPITHVKELPQKTKIIMLVGKKDTTVPPKQSYTYFERAKKLGKNIYLHEVNAEHDTHQIDKKLRVLVHELLD